MPAGIRVLEPYPPDAKLIVLRLLAFYATKNNLLIGIINKHAKEAPNTEVCTTHNNMWICNAIHKLITQN